MVSNSGTTADRTVGMFPRRVEQSGLLQQDRGLEHVGHRLAHRDDVVRHRLGTEHVHGPRGGAHDVEFLARPARTVRRPGRPAVAWWPARRPAARRGRARTATGSRDARPPRPAARRSPLRAPRSSAACPDRTGESRRRAPLLAAGRAGRRPAPRCRWRAATRRRRRGRRAIRRVSRSAGMPRSSSCSGWRSRICAAVAVRRPWITRSARRYGSSARAGSAQVSASAASSSLIFTSRTDIDSSCSSAVSSSK